MSSKTGFVYDDEASDSDDDQLEEFKNKFQQQIDEKDDEESDEDDALEEEEDDEESDGDDEHGEEEDSNDEDLDSDESDLVKPAPRLMSTEQMKKLSNIQQRLQNIEDDDDNAESSEDEEMKALTTVTNEVDQENQSNEETGNDEVKNKGKSVSTKEVNDNEVKSKYSKSRDGNEEEERNKFRNKLSKMSFADIQRLKNKLGLKLFNQKLEGKKSQQKTAEDFKRENKQRPREMSSKKQVGRLRNVTSSAKPNTRRDPRFDPNCGEFDDKLFKYNYKFVNKYKANDLAFLKAQLHEEEDGERRQSIKYLIQRTENQMRQLKNDRVKEESERAEREEKRSLLKQGIKPQYVSKSKQREQELVKKYEILKEKGGLDKYINKKQKKNMSKDRKKINKF